MTFCRMSRALLVQMNGLGLVLRWAMYSSMAVINSGTLVNTPPAQPFGRDVAEESLHHVEPRGRSRREVHVESRMFVQPRLHRGVLVGDIVVGNHVQRLVLRSLPIDLAQELQPLDVRVPRLALADDLAVKDVERGERRCGAVALVVVCHGRRAPFLQRQFGLCMVQLLSPTES